MAAYPSRSGSRSSSSVRLSVNEVPVIAVTRYSVVAWFEVLRHNSTFFALPVGDATVHAADALPSPASISARGDRLLGIGPPLSSGVSST